MGHIKTNKTLHLTEILTLSKSFTNFLQSTEDHPSRTSSSFFKKNWFLGLNSVISLQRLPRTTLFELICCVYAVNRFSKHRRGTTRAVWGFTDRLWTNQISWDPVCMSWSCNNYQENTCKSSLQPNFIILTEFHSFTVYVDKLQR